MNPQHMAQLVAAGIGLLLLLFVVSFSWYTVDQTERGVLLRNGAVKSLSDPGLHFKVPFIDTVQTISVQTHVTRWADQTAMATYSRDQQPANIAVSVNYRVTDPMALYGEYQSIGNMLNRLVLPTANEQVRNVFGQFNAVAAVQERARLNLEVEQAIRDNIDGPLVIERVQIENIDFSDAYENSVEQRMLAEVEVQRLQQNALREQVEAEIVVIQATAAAERVRLAGNAEAAAIDARGQALQNNPQLVGLVAAEKWNGVLPTTMLPGSAVPWIQVPQ